MKFGVFFLQLKIFFIYSPQNLPSIISPRILMSRLHLNKQTNKKAEKQFHVDLDNELVSETHYL